MSVRWTREHYVLNEHSNWNLNLLKEKAQTNRTDLIHYALISLHFVLWTFLCGLAERWDSVLLQAHYSAHGMRISALCRSLFGAFRIIILLHNERLLIAFLVRLIYHMFLPHYCAIHLKEMSFNFTVYIFTYKYIVFHECILKQYKAQCISFYI